MTWLKEAGYGGVGLNQALAEFRSGSGHGHKPVAITFDDGLLDSYTEAFPVLKRYGFGATMFLPTSLLGTVSSTGAVYLGWDQVREMRKGGIEFGSHTLTHPVLYDLDENQIRRELLQSRLEIESQLGEPVVSFAYPYRFPEADRRYVAGFRSLLREADYKMAVTTTIGRVRPGDDLFTLKRLPINAHDDKSLLLAKIEGAYDWLALPQRFYKGMRYRLSTRRGSLSSLALTGQ